MEGDFGNSVPLFDKLPLEERLRLGVDNDDLESLDREGSGLFIGIAAIPPSSLSNTEGEGKQKDI